MVGRFSRSSAKSLYVERPSFDASDDGRFTGYRIRSLVYYLVENPSLLDVERNFHRTNFLYLIRCG